MIFGAILAGGVGSRMHMAGMPKQFLTLGEKPIVIHTLETFLLCSRFDRVYVGVHPQWLLHMQDLVDTFVPKQKDRVSLVPGGGDRNDTIFKVAAQIEQDFGESDDHILVTHDSVRPFVTYRIIEENIRYARECGACDTVIPASDTIVESRDGGFISNIPEREKMFQGQTPQSFKAKHLRKIYQSLTDAERAILTDACKICVLKNEPVHLVEGDVSNIKITYPHDLRVAEAILGGNRTC